MRRVAVGGLLQWQLQPCVDKSPAELSTGVRGTLEYPAACAVPDIAGQIFQVPFISVRPNGLTVSVPASFT